MQIQQANRQLAYIKLALQGPSGSGKTYSALLLAHGLCNDWSKIVLIDTENGSANLYAHLGPFNILTLDAPYSPERYMNAIELALKSGEVIIIDSISQCWEFLKDFHSNLAGNSFTNWAKVNPRHKAFVDSILLANAHVICTMRTKQEYVLNQKDGKYVPEKVGLKAIQRDGIDYDFTLVFDIDHKHHCKASKDRTGLFMDHPEYEAFLIDKTTGERIISWIQQGDLKEQILNCASVDKLNELYRRYRPKSTDVVELFKYQKHLLSTSLVSN